MAPELFVYGTLMPGHLRWGILAPHARSHRPAVADGTLYDTGQGWPSATFAAVDGAHEVGGRGRAEPMSLVPGWLVELEASTAATLLAQLDEIEGLAPVGAVDEAALRLRYRRRQITTVDGTSAWAYESAWVDSAWVPIERWTTQAEQ